MSLKSTCTPGRNGSNIKAKDLKYSRGAFWLTSRESPDIFWMEKLDSKDEAVKAYIVRNKSDIEDKHFLDHADAFDTFLQRWEGKSLVAEYKQAPTKKDEVGEAFPNLNELNDLVVSTKGTENWKTFIETGEQVDEQDLQGFEGYEDEDLGDDDCDRAVREEAADSMLGASMPRMLWLPVCLHLTGLMHVVRSCAHVLTVDDEAAAAEAAEAEAGLAPAQAPAQAEEEFECTRVPAIDVDAPRATTRAAEAAIDNVDHDKVDKIVEPAEGLPPPRNEAPDQHLCSDGTSFFS